MTGFTGGLGGQVALVTGAARGIGRGIVVALAEQGADIVLNDLRPEPDADEVTVAVRALGRAAASSSARTSASPLRCHGSLPRPRDLSAVSTS